MNLQQRSIEIIRAWQFDGAYAACLTFSQYGYSWLRDGAWVAYGMDAAGQSASARAFHQWAGRILCRYSEKVDSLLAKIKRAEPLQDADYLPTRFELDGRLDQTDWPNFQLDGYGAWLWCAVQFIQIHGDKALWEELRPAVSILVAYLDALWQSPNYDCWEEHRHHQHPATWAALYGGLKAVRELDITLVPPHLPETIQAYVLAHAVSADGHFMKFIGNDAVDASLLWLAVPYQLVDVHDPRFEATLAKIERDIHRSNGGVYRYQADTYYGAGEWPLLTAWLAWVYLERGDVSRAKALLAWVEEQANSNGEIAEQVSGHLLTPSYYPHWVEKWGTPASPLLWSHGMYLLLNTLLKGR